MLSARYEDPTASRFHSEFLAGKTVIKIPARRSLPIMAFLAFWLAGWSVGGFGAIQSLLDSSKPLGGRAFILFWLGGWIVGEVLVSLTLLWMAFGYERITASLNSVGQSMVIFVQFRRKNFLPSAIQNMRFRVLAANKGTKWQKSYSQDIFGRANIEFEYGPKTISMGRNLDRGETDAVIALIEKATGRKLGR